MRAPAYIEKAFCVDAGGGQGGKHLALFNHGRA